MVCEDVPKKVSRIICTPQTQPAVMVCLCFVIETKKKSIEKGVKKQKLPYVSNGEIL